MIQFIIGIKAVILVANVLQKGRVKHRALHISEYTYFS